LGTLGFGAGVFSRRSLSQKINLNTNAHLGFTRPAVNSTRLAADNVGFRNYVSAHDMQSKIESNLSLSKYASGSFAHFHFWLKPFMI
jgi:hypothetical protein